jgi:diguanylate cyclase (GGDEF)-like protein/PAS domain S-box-containing protein
MNRILNGKQAASSDFLYQTMTSYDSYTLFILAQQFSSCAFVLLNGEGKVEAFTPAVEFFVNKQIAVGDSFFELMDEQSVKSARPLFQQLCQNPVPKLFNWQEDNFYVSGSMIRLTGRKNQAERILVVVQKKLFSDNESAKSIPYLIDFSQIHFALANCEGVVQYCDEGFKRNFSHISNDTNIRGFFTACEESGNQSDLFEIIKSNYIWAGKVEAAGFTSNNFKKGYFFSHFFGRVDDNERQYIIAYREVAFADNSTKKDLSSYEELFINSHDAEFLLDPQFKILAANPMATKLLGFDNAFLIGQDFRKLFSHSELYPLSEIMDSAADKVFRFDSQMRHQELECIDVEVSISWLITGTRKLHSVVHGISERKQIEQALAESELHHRSFFEFLPIALFDCDITDSIKYLQTLREEGVKDLTESSHDEPVPLYKCLELVDVLNVNLAGMQLLGQDNKPRIIGKGVLQDLFSKETLKNLSEAVELLEFGQSVVILEAREKVQDGQMKDLNIRLSIMPGKSEAQVRLLGLITDVTHQARSAKLQTAVYRISEAAHAVDDLNELYTSIHQIISELVAAKNLYIALYDEQARELQFPYWVDQMDKKIGPKPLGRGLTEYVLRTGEPKFITQGEFNRLTTLGEVELIGSLPLAWMGVPLITDGKTIGVLAIQTYYECDVLTGEDLMILQFCSSQIANAIERKMSQTALLENRKQLNQIIMDNPIPMIVIDKDHRITHWNTANEHLTGITAKEMIGKTQTWRPYYPQPRKVLCDLLVDGWEHEQIQEMYGGMLSRSPFSEEGFEGEGFFGNLGSCGKWLSFTATSLRNLEGEVIGAIEIIQDITNQKIAAEALIQSEARYRAVVEDQSEKICRFLPDGTITFVNDAFNAAFDLDGINWNVLNLISTKNTYLQHIIRSIRNASIDNPVITFENKRRTDTGEEIWEQWVNRALFDEYGKMKECQLIGMDITDRKQAEESLRRYTERLKSLHEIDQAILEAHSSEAIASAVLSHFQELVTFDQGLVATFDQEKQTADLLAMQVGSRGSATSRIAYPINYFDCPMDDRCWKKSNWLINDMQLEQNLSPYQQHYLSEGGRTMLTIPLIAVGEVLGIMSIGALGANGFSVEHVEIAEEVAHLMAIALHQAKLYEKVGELAATDPLTGIYNRRQLVDSGQSEFVRAQRYGKSLSLMIFDIDHYKKINDSLGHIAGDKALVELADCVKAQLREVDIFGRYGGDEFVIILPETDLMSAYSVAERIRKNIHDTVFNIDSAKVDITISVGVTTNKEGTKDIWGMVDRADAALYAAKRAGRDGVVAI